MGTERIRYDRDTQTFLCTICGRRASVTRYAMLNAERYMEAKESFGKHANCWAREPRPESSDRVRVKVVGSAGSDHLDEHWARSMRALGQPVT